MDATKKAKDIDNVITKLTGKDRQETVKAFACMTCSNTDLTFRDRLSKEEYRISGMCQSCQDETFGV